MRQTNRVEPVGAGTDADDVTRATVTTTTRMEFVRRVQVVPMNEAVAQLHTDLNQSLAGDVTISPRIWAGMNRVATPVAVRGSRRTLWLIGCLFITVGLLALCAMIIGLTIAFGKTNTIGESGIERYDIGDLHYGMANVNENTFPSNIYLSSNNQAAVQKYLSDQLLSEPGYRGLFIDGVLVQQQSATNGRKRRDTSCSTTFIVRNIQVYFDQCSTCVGARNLALRRSLTNFTSFRQPLDLSINNGSMSQISTQICSTPNISRLIVPVRLSILQAQQLNSGLLPVNTYVPTIETQSSYSTYIYSTRPTTRSSYIFTSRSISTQKTTTTTTTTTSTLPPLETSSQIATTIFNDISTIISTISSDSTPTTEFTITETLTTLNKIDDTTSSTGLMTTSETFEETTTAEQSEETTSSVDDTTASEGYEETSTAEQFEETTSSADETTTANEFKETTSSIDETTTEQFEETTSVAEETTTSNEFEETTSSANETTTSDGFEETTYPTDLTSPSIESLSTETSLFNSNTTTEFEDRTSPSLTNYTNEETSTIDFLENTTMSNEVEITSRDNYEDITSPTTDDLSTITNTTIKSNLSETTVSNEDTSDSLTEIQTTTSLFDYSTEISDTSTIFDSIITENSTINEIDTSSHFFDESTTETPEIQSSTISSYTEETSVSPIYHSTSIKAVTTNLQSSAKRRASTTNSLRQTTAKISPFVPYKPFLPTSSSSLNTASRLTSRSMFSFTSIKPRRTRKQTFYSTAFISPTTQGYGTSLAVTPTNTYRPTSSIRRRRFTTVTPLMSTARTNIRSYTTATFPLTTGTQRRGRFRSSTGQLKQTTYNPTSLRPQTTTSTYHQTTVLPTTTIEQSSTSLSSTEMMTIESTIATDLYIETSSASSTIEIDNTRDLSIDDLSTSSSTNKYDLTISPIEYYDNSTESSLTIDLTSTISDELSTNEDYITSSSKSNTRTTTVVSTSGMITISRLLNNLTDQQHLHLSSSATTASLINAYLESSSITSVTITQSSIQLTEEEMNTKSTILLQTLFDSSFPWINQETTSRKKFYNTRDSSQFQSLITTISTINDIKSTTSSIYEQMKFTTLADQYISNKTSTEFISTYPITVTQSTNSDKSEFRTLEHSSNSMDNDEKSSTNLMHSITPDLSSILKTHLTKSNEINTISNFVTSSISSLANEDVLSSTKHITNMNPLFTIMSTAITSTEFPSTIYQPIYLSSSLHQKQSSSTFETFRSTRGFTTADIITSTDLKFRTSAIETETSSSILPNVVATNNDIPSSTSRFINAESVMSSTEHSSFSSSTVISNSSQPSSTNDSNLTVFPTNTHSTVNEENISSTQHSLLSSSEQVINTDTMTDASSITKTRSFVHTSSAHSSTIAASVSDVSSSNTLSTVEHINDLSTLPTTTLDTDSEALKLTSTESSKTDMISSTKLASYSSKFIPTTNYKSSTIFDKNTLNTVEHTLSSTTYSSFTSTKHVTSIISSDTITSSYSNSNIDETTQNLFQDETIVTTQNPTEYPRHSTIPSNSDRISTTIENTNKVSTQLASTIEADRTYKLITSSITPEPYISTSIDTNYAINSVASTTHSLNVESSPNSSIHLSSEQVTTSDIITPSVLVGTTTVTFLATTDASIIQHSNTNDDIATVSQDRSVSTNKITSTPSTLSTILSGTHQIVTKTSMTTNSESSEMDTISSMNLEVTSSHTSETDTISLKEIDTTTIKIISNSTEHLPSTELSSKRISNIDTTTPTLLVSNNKTTTQSNIDLSSSHTSNMITYTSEVSSIEAVTPGENSEKAFILSSPTLEPTIDTSILTHSSTPITDDSSSNLLLQTSTSEHATDNKFSTLLFLADGTDITSPSASHLLTLHSSSATTLTSDHGNNKQISTLSSIVTDPNQISTPTSVSTSDSNSVVNSMSTTQQTTYQTNIITSKNIDTTINITPTTSTYLHLLSKYTNEKITESWRQISILTSNNGLETSTSQISMPTHSVSSSTTETDNLIITSPPSTGSTEMKSSLLTLSDEVSNTHTMTPTLMTDIDVITTISEVSEAKLLSTVESDTKLSMLPTISTDFDRQRTLMSNTITLGTASSSGEKHSTNKFISKTTMMPTNEQDTTITDDESTVLPPIVNGELSSTEYFSSEQITNVTIDTRSATLSVTDDRTSTVSKEQTMSTDENVHEITSESGSTINYVTSDTHSTEIQGVSSSTIASITAVDSVASSLMDLIYRTTLFPTIISQVTKTSVEHGISWKKSEEQRLSTLTHINGETISSTVSSDADGTTTESSINADIRSSEINIISSSTFDTSNTDRVSQTNIDLSSNSVTVPFTVHTTILTSTGFISTSSQPAFLSATIDTSTSSLHQKQSSSTFETLKGTRSSTPDIITSTDLKPTNTATETETPSSIFVNDNTTRNDNPFSTSRSVDVEHVINSTEHSSISWLTAQSDSPTSSSIQANEKELSTQTLITDDSNLAVFSTNKLSTLNEQISSSPKHSFLSSSEQVVNTDTMTDTSSTITMQSFVHTSSAHSSTIIASVSDVSSSNTLSSVEHINILSTLPTTTVDNDLEALKFTSSETSGTEFMPSTETEPYTSQFISTINVENILSSSAYSSLTSSKHVTSADSIASSYSNFDIDETTENLFQHETIITTENSNEFSRQSTISSNTNRISSTLENSDKVSTSLSSSLEAHTTSMVMTSSSTLQPDLSTSIENNSTFNTVSSTKHSFILEGISSSSVHSSLTQTRNIDIITISAFADNTNVPFLTTSDAPIIQHSNTNDDIATISQDRTLSTNIITNTPSTLSTILSGTHQIVTKTSMTTNSESSEMDRLSTMNLKMTTSHASETNTLLLKTIDTTETNTISSSTQHSPLSELSSSEQTSNIHTLTSTLIISDVGSTILSNADLSSSHTSNMITSTSEVSSIQTVTPVENSDKSLVFSSTTLEPTIDTSKLTHSSTPITDDSSSNILLQTSTSEHLNELSKSKSVSTSDSNSDVNSISTTEQNTYQTNIITSENIDTTINISPTTSTYSHLLSEYTSQTIKEPSTPISISTSSEGSQTSSNQITMPRNSVSSSTSETDNLIITSPSSTATIEMKSSLLTSSDEVSNIHSMTPTLMTDINVITTIPEVSEDKLLTTVVSENKLSMSPTISTYSNKESILRSSTLTLATRSSSDEEDTTANQVESTVSPRIVNLRLSSAEYPSSERITTDARFVTVTDTNDGTSIVSKARTTSIVDNAQKLTSESGSTINYVTSDTRSTDVQGVSSSTISSTTAANSVTPSSIDSIRRTTLFSKIISPFIKTSEEQRLSTLPNMNEEIISSMTSSDADGTTTETSVVANSKSSEINILSSSTLDTRDNEKVSQTNIDISSDSVTVPFTTHTTILTSTELPSTIDQPLFLSSSIDTSTSSLHQTQSSSTFETLKSTRSLTADITTSTDRTPTRILIETETFSSLLPNFIITKNDISTSTSRTITIENIISSTDHSSFLSSTVISDSSLQPSTDHANLTIFPTNSLSPMNEQIATSAQHSLLSSSEQVVNTDTMTDASSTTKNEPSVHTSSLHSSTIVASVSAVSSQYQTLSSVEHMNELSTLPITTLDNDSQALKFISTETSKTDLISSTQLEPFTTQFIPTTNDKSSNIFATNTLNTVENILSSSAYSSLTSSKHVTSIVSSDSIASSYSNSNIDETTQNLFQHETIVTTENPAKSPRHSTIPSNSDRISTTIGNSNKVSTQLASTIETDRTYKLMTNSITPESYISTSIETNYTINSVASTTHSPNVENSPNLSTHLSSEQATNIRTISPSTIANSSTATLLTTTDASIIQHSNTNDDIATVSQDRTLSTNIIINTASKLSVILSSTHKSVTKTSIATKSQSSEMDTISSMNLEMTSSHPSPTDTMSLNEIYTTTNNIISSSTQHSPLSELSSSEQTSNIHTLTSTLIISDAGSTILSNTDLSSSHTSNMITSTSEVSSIQTVTPVENSDKSLVLSPTTLEPTMDTSILTHSSTPVNDDSNSNILLQTSTSEHAADNKFSTLLFLADSTDLISPSTFHPLTLHRSSVNTLTSVMSQDRSITNEENNNQLSTLSSILTDTNVISTSISVSTSDSNSDVNSISTTEQTTYQTNIITSKNIDTTINITPTTSTYSHLLSEYTNEKIQESSTQISITTSSGRSQTSSNQVTVPINTLSSSTTGSDNLVITSIPPNATFELKSSLLPSSDEVSNIHTMTPTLMTDINVITTIPEVSEDKLLTTVVSENKLSMSPTISTNANRESTLMSDTLTLATTSLSNEDDTTTNQDESTVSQPIVNVELSSTEYLSSERITSDLRFLTVTDTDDHTSKISKAQTTSIVDNARKLTSDSGSTMNSVTSGTRFTDVVDVSSSTISSITAVDSVASSFSRTTLLSTISSPVIKTSNDDRNIWKTSEEQRLSTLTNMNEEIISSTTSSDSDGTTTETSIAANSKSSESNIFPSSTLDTNNNDRVSQTNIDLSSNIVTVPFTIDTSVSLSKIDSSTLESLNIDTTSWNAAENRLDTTLKNDNKPSTIDMIVTSNDRSSTPMPILLSSITSTVEFVTSTNIKTSDSQRNSILSSESYPVSTSDPVSINSFITVEHVLDFNEDSSGSSSDDLSLTNTGSISFLSSDSSSIRPRPTSIPSISNIIPHVDVTTTQATVDKQSTLYTSSNQRVSTTDTILSTETGTTSRLSATTSITNSDSTFLVSNFTDNLPLLSSLSQNEADIETTTSNLNNSISASTSNRHVEEVFVSTNSVIRPSQSNSKAETSSSEARSSTSDLGLAHDYSTLSTSTQSTSEKTISYTIKPIHSTIFNQRSNKILEQTTYDTASSVSVSFIDRTPISISSTTRSFPFVTSTSTIPVVETSTSNTFTHNSSSNISNVTNSMNDSTTIPGDFITTTKDNSYTDRQTLSSSQTISYSTTENINHASDSILSSGISTNDLLALQLSTKVTSHMESSSSESQMPTSKNDFKSAIDSRADTTRSLDITKSEPTSSYSKESSSRLTDTVSSEVTQQTSSPSILIQSVTQLLNSESQQDHDTSTINQNPILTTRLSDQSSSKQIFEHLDSTTIEQPQKLTSSHSDQFFSKISTQYTIDKIPTSSVSSEATDNELISTITLQSSDGIEQMSTVISQSSVDKSTLSNTLISQPALQTSNISVSFNSDSTYPSSVYSTLTTTNIISSNDHISTLRSSLFSNDKIAITTITNSEQKVKNTQSLTTSSGYTSLKDLINTKSFLLTSSTDDSTIPQNKQNIQSTETISDKLFTSIQSTLISHNQTSTIKPLQNENNFSTIKSFLEILNITSSSP